MTGMIFTCAHCRREVEGRLSEEEAREQYEREFPDVPFVVGGTPMVCGDCFEAMQRQDAEFDQLEQMERDDAASFPELL